MGFLLVECHVKLHGVAVAHDRQCHLVVHGGGAHVAEQRIVVVHCLAVERHDGVAGLHSGLGRRAVVDHGLHLRATAGHAVRLNRGALDGDAERHVLHGAVVDDLVSHTLYQVRRNGEADADGSGGAGRRCGGCDG